MATLTEQLLSDTRALPQSPDSPSTMYEDLMRTASNVLNSISTPTKEASLTERAQLATQACTTIFKERVIRPGHEDYEEARQSNWSSTCWLPAACFVKCQSNMEVAIALKVVKHFECKFLAVMAEWEHERDDEKAEVVMGELIEGIHREARKREGLVEWWFMNDAASGQDVFRGYGEEEGRLRGGGMRRGLWGGCRAVGS